MRLLPLLLLLACEDARRSTAVPLEVEPSVTASGPWSISAARFELRAVRYREPEPVALLDRLVPVARAHPGHAPDAGLVGEWLGPVDVDLLAGGDLGTATFHEGAVAAAEIDLAAVVVEGEAGDRPFRFEVAGPVTVLGSRIDVEVDADAPPTLALAVDLAAILSDLDPAAAPPEGTWTLADDPTYNTFVFGLVRGARWTWSAR